MDRFQIIQGDSVEAYIEVDGQEADDVEAIEFHCQSLNATYELFKTTDDRVWWIYISSEDTSQFRVGCFMYELVATLFGGIKKTIVYDQELEILHKDNLWTEAT